MKMSQIRGLSLSILLLFFYSVQAVVLWHDRNPGDGNPPITMDVFNDDIDIAGVNELSGAIHVVAENRDILVTVTTNDSVLTGDPHSVPRLYLFTDVGRTITFELTHDLMFRGTADANGDIDLLVSVTGAGTVEFFIEGDQQVTFTSLTNTGGAEVYVGMQTDGPTLRFRRFTNLGPIEQAEDVEIGVGPKSCISYLSTNAIAVNGGADDTATIAFDPSNVGDGRMILRIDNDSCFVIWGHLVTSLSTNFTLSDITLSEPAGKLARFVVENSQTGANATAGLMLVNQNKLLTNLLIDPWDDDAFVITGTQVGFILGANGAMQINNLAYLDYVGTCTNQCPDPDIPADILDGRSVQDVVKERNPSAFWIDGNPDPNAVPAQILLEGASAIVFRSGVDADGNVDPNAGSSGYVIDFAKKTPGAGNIVMDVEAQLDIFGQTGVNKLEILSLDVFATGGSVLVGSGQTVFPLRSFLKDSNGDYLRYNNACFFINNRMIYHNAVLFHSDLNHQVFEKNFLPSEPTYVGGETFVLNDKTSCSGQRPKIIFDNASFELHSSAALTGVDLFVPNEPTGNASNFTFFYNGYVIDSGNGRQLNLGTSLGSTSCCGSLIDQDAHLDIFQEGQQLVDNVQTLTLLVAPNDGTITEGLTGDIEGQFSVNTIYLANSTNISIGTEGTMAMNQTCTAEFPIVTHPLLWIAGDFFSFSTQGGLKNYPESSATEGQGGMFVDTNGTVAIQDFLRANIDLMIATSANGTINLPKKQVYFNRRIGISRWNIDLNDPDQRVIIPSDQNLSDFTLDWIDVTKDYSVFTPYELPMVPGPCACPPIVPANYAAIPVVEGIVDQFQVKRSRLGDAVNLLVSNGGWIKELVFLTGFDSGEAPIGNLFIEDFSTVGINSAHRTVDSLDTAVKLGVNGLNIIALGDGTIELNTNTLIDNVCHITAGDTFGELAPQTLLIHATVPTELRVQSDGGILDLSSFTTTNQILEFGGEVRLVFEPGARVILGGGTIKFTDNAQIVLDPITDSNKLVGVDPSTNDDSRVRLSGTGNVIMQDNSLMFVGTRTNFGVETFFTCNPTTDITWTLNDQAKIQIGNQFSDGGVFQIGNSRGIERFGSRQPVDDAVNFSLVINGSGAEFRIDRQGMLGLGAGIVDKLSSVPNEWLIGSLFSVGEINITVQQGKFVHNQIFDGNSTNASLLAIGGNGTFNVSFNIPNAIIPAGGNIFLVDLNDESVAPIVDILADDHAGIMSSLDLLIEPGHANSTVHTAATPAQIFAYFSTIPYQQQLAKLSNIAQDDIGQQMLGYVRTVGGSNFIFRPIVFRIEGGGSAEPVDPQPSVDRGAVAITLQETTGNLSSLQQLVGFQI